ncbi:MAG TPA: hypothetical protein VN363_02125 [Anaerolineales bacterium]|nr:hypothetical protein [Anaerolineales bacterium]
MCGNKYLRHRGSPRASSTRASGARLLCGLVLLALIAGCSAPAALQPPTATPVLPTPTQVPPTATFTPLPTETPVPSATPTETPVPTETQTPTPTETATPTLPPPTPSGEDALYIYYILRESGGPVGCGDTAIKINTGLWRTGDVAQDTAAALKSLFALRYQEYGSLYNGLYASNLKVDSVTFKAFEGIISIRLSGSYGRTEDRCDNSRSRAQIWSTIRQFSDVKTIDILLNGNLLGDILANDH